ncbi:hypothetical protein KAR91_60755 [Candidatus Pacearchaeota archaeon]|nr:hypothetical protein [Candidatus Pacearchaeota archaeon]
MFSEEFEFLAWFFTFIEGDFINCPKCDMEIEKDDVEGCLNVEETGIICPHCGKVINKEDLEI